MEQSDLTGTDDRTAIGAASAALLNGVNASDVACVMDVWSDDGILMPPHHPSVHGSTAIKEYFTRLFLQGRFAFSFTSSQIECAHDVAVERVEYSASFWPSTGEPKYQESGKGIHVYRRGAGGSWKLVYDIWNADTA